MSLYRLMPNSRHRLTGKCTNAWCHRFVEVADDFNDVWGIIAQYSMHTIEPVSRDEEVVLYLNGDVSIWDWKIK